MSSHMIVVEC